MNGPGFGKFSVVIDVGWLLHQCSFESCETFGSICMKYMALVANFGNGQCTKDRAHKRRTLSYRANISLNKDTKYTLRKQRFFANSHNKTKLISLLTEILSSWRVCVVTAAEGKWAIRYGGYTADIWRKYGGYTADGRRTCGEHTADIRQTYVEHTANIRRTCAKNGCRHTADMRHYDISVSQQT